MSIPGISDSVVCLSTSETNEVGSDGVSCRFMPADALWAFAMACNVYLTFFRKYDAKQLRLLEWRYILFCYGIPFIPAFVYFFVKSKSHGRVYGSAVVCHAILLPIIWLGTDFF
jgi:hypothetical protein